MSSASPPSKRRCFVGREQTYRRDHMEIASPIQHSVITDWEGLERLISYTFRSHLSLSPQEHPILWCEPTGGSREQRERMLTLLMESAGVPAVFFCKSAVLSAFAAGRSTALICESGAGVTTVAPVHEGYVLNKGVRRTKVAGNTLDGIAQRLFFPSQSQPTSLSESRPAPLYSIQRAYAASGAVVSSVVVPPHTTASFHAFAQAELVRDVKETACRLSETPFDVNGPKLPTVPYELPDGQTLEVGNERFVVPEHLFQPTLQPALAQYAEEFDSSFTFTGLQHMVRALSPRSSLSHCFAPGTAHHSDASLTPLFCSLSAFSHCLSLLCAAAEFGGECGPGPAQGAVLVAGAVRGDVSAGRLPRACEPRADGGPSVGAQGEGHHRRLDDGPQVRQLDGRLHPRIAGHLPPDVAQQAGVRGAGHSGYPRQVPVTLRRAALRVVRRTSKKSRDAGERSRHRHCRGDVECVDTPRWSYEVSDRTAWWEECNGCRLMSCGRQRCV